MSKFREPWTLSAANRCKPAGKLIDLSDRTRLKFTRRAIECVNALAGMEPAEAAQKDWLVKEIDAALTPYKETPRDKPPTGVIRQDERQPG